MDETIAKWIIEFLIRQKLHDKLINGVISSLPLAKDDYRLKKTMLLRKIESKISNGSVSAKLLELIEIVEALDDERGKTASDLMKEAYCMVAVDCTARFLEESAEENVKYLEKVEEVWRRRVNLAEGLVSESAKRWFEDIEVAARDEVVCERLLGMNTRKEALKSVKAYLKEAWEGLGPSFLELVAAKGWNSVEDVCRGGYVAGGGVSRGGGDNLVCLDNRCREIVAFDGTQAPLRRKHVAVKGKRQRGGKISDADEELMNMTGDNATGTEKVHDATAEVDRVQEATMPGSRELSPGNNRLSDDCQRRQTLSSTLQIDNNKTLSDNLKVPQMLTTPVKDRQRGGKILDADEELMNMTGDNTTGTEKVHVVTAEVDRVQEATMSGSRERSPGNNCLSDDFQRRQTFSSTLPTDNNETLSDNLKVPQMLTTPYINRVQEALKHCTRELQAAVIDPLPNALQTAQTLASAMATDNLETAGGNQTLPVGKEVPVVCRVQEEQRKPLKTKANSDDVMAEQTRPEVCAPNASTANDAGDTEKQDNHEDDAHGHVTVDPRKQETVQRRSLMEPNGTGHTYEWDDSIENCSPRVPVRTRLQSPRVTRNSTSKPAKDEEFRFRRKRKRWSSLEEETLRAGVKKFGHGNWKLILQCYDDIFLERTDGDLKDKWRNMTRS